MDPSFGTLRCTLLDRRSSVALADARVMCIGRAGRVFAFDADAQGSFVAELPEGVYDLVISARGYLSLTVRGVGILAGHEQDVVRGLVPGEGQRLDGVPATAIAGFVRDRVGQLVGNVAIYVNADRGGAAYTTRTDRGGAFVLNGVVPGMYDLIARAGERTVASQHVPIANVKDLIRVDLTVTQS